jgi:hypothetical protein
VSTTRKDLELEDERSAEKRYAKKLREKASRPVTFDGPRNLSWTRDGLPRQRQVPVGELVGRVALQAPDDWVLDGDKEFYIGERHLDLDGVEVFSSAAPIACTFFRGTNHHKLCDDVAVIRSFVHRNGQIVDFTDDVVGDDAPAQPFRKRGLSIPAPPSRPGLPPRDVPIPGKPAPPSDEATPRHRPPGPAIPKERHHHDHGVLPVRAEVALRAQLQTPRTKSLSPVLSTLQPDQYELVTVPAMDSMIIEGKPGTGKTIIASHRAAYLVDAQTPAENTLDGNVLVIGPTTAYTRHIRTIISRLAGDSERIKVMSLPELMQNILVLKEIPRGPISTTWRDVDWELGRFARRAIVRLEKARGVTPTTEQVYELLRLHAEKVTKDVEWISYLRGLPPYKSALPLGTHSPLLAFIRWQVAAPDDLKGIEHIIIDEAQDVTSLAWFLLDEINEADAWTILGDLNQRRSDHTLSSWPQVLELIAIAEDTPIRKLKRGYRSTRPILEFASRLLPRGERLIYAFQEEGPAPTVEKSRPKDLGATVVAQVERVLAAYSMGTVAVITVDPGVVTKTLRSKGWKATGFEAQLWEKD